jgi:hydroxyethylthiazole kinase
VIAVSVNLGVADVVAAVTALRSATPPVTCLVDPDRGALASRVLAAAGARPARGTEAAGAVLVGLGAADAAAVRAAAAAARERGARWVLDLDTGGRPGGDALELLGARPAAVRGTPAEVRALATSGRPVEGEESLERVFHASNDLALRTGAVVAVSGEVALVTDGERCVRVEGGRLAPAAGVATAVAAVVAAHLAVTDDALLAVVAAHAQVAAAAEVAAGGRAAGADLEGWVEATAALGPDVLAERTRLA